MKKLFFQLFAWLILLPGSNFAQSLTFTNQTALPCSSVSFPITASGFTSNVGAMTLFIQVNTSVLQCTGHTPGTLTGYNINTNVNPIALTFSNPSGLNINGTLLTLHFTYKGGTSALDFTGACEITYASPPTNPPVTYTDGNISATLKTTWYVDAAVGSSGTGTSWASPLKTITEAANKALTPGDEVLVKPGTYNESLNIKSNGSELVPVKYNITLSDTNKITFPSGTDLSCVSPASYPGKYYAYVFRSWKANSGAYPILPVNDAQDYVIVDNAAFIPETGASGDTSLVQASIGLPVFYKKFSSNPATERVIVNAASVSGSKANCYIGTAIGTGDSATAANYNIIDGIDLTGMNTGSSRLGLRVQSSSFNVYKNSYIYNLDSVGIYVSGSSLKPARHNIISNNKIYNTWRRAIKIGRHGGSTANANYAYNTHILYNEIYVQDDGTTTNDQLWNMADIHIRTAFTIIEGNTFRNFNSQSAGKGTVEIWDNVRKTNVSNNFFKDIGKSFTGTNSIVYVRNNSLNINIFNNVLLNSATVDDDIFAFRFNAEGHTNSNAVYNTVFNIDNGILFEDSGAPVPVFRVQNNILHINYLGGGVYFTHTGTTGRFTVSNNCYPSTPTSAGQPYDGETGRQIGDPQFVNPTFYGSPHGLQLKTGSICLATGTAVTGINRDYVKNPRSASTPSIGAFESVLTSLSWSGASNQDWHNYLNWSPELVPTNFLQAVIPLKSNQPVVSTSNAVCKGLQLQSGANLGINNGRLLTIY